MRRRHIALFTAAAMLLASCVKEPIETTPGTGDEGSRTRISLTLQPERSTEPEQNGMSAVRTLSSVTRTTPADETVIHNLHVLVFAANGLAVSNEHFSDLAFTGYTPSSLSVDTYTGRGMRIYVVANGDVNDDADSNSLIKELNGVATVEQLQALMVKVKGDGLSRTERLTMVGTITTDITKPHNTAISIPLYYLAAKVTFSLKDNTPADLDITITGWGVVDIPKQSYLLGRLSSEDAVDGSTAADYISTTDSYEFESINPSTKTWTQTFYCFENRRGKRVDRPDPTDPENRYPNMKVTDNNQRGKGWYAPAGATCVLVYGTHTKDGQTNQIIYKLFLGANSINDYNIERGKHYKYNVIINNLKDINVDTNVDWGSASFSVDHSDNLDEMDAHPDFRVFRIGGTAVDTQTPAYATVEVFEADGTTPCTWLAVSPLNLYRHGIKQSGVKGSQQQYGQSSAIGSYVRSRYNPTVTAESTYDEATYGMTRKLTRIPFVQPAAYGYQNIVVYADALDTPDATRTGKVVITHYKGADGTEEDGQLTYTVTQAGPIRVSDSLFVERYEESAMTLLHPGLPAVVQNASASMQWGYTAQLIYSNEELRYTNGNWLTANAVYTRVQARSGMVAPKWTAPNYSDSRPIWPNTGAVVVYPTKAEVADQTYFYPAIQTNPARTTYFDPIYNSSAARYCHEKNRDMDGDGVISAEETVWYLPSYADLWYISRNMPQGLVMSAAYWSSSEEEASKARYCSVSSKTTTSAAKSSRYRVRCVRGIGAVLPDATIESTEADTTVLTLSYKSKSDGKFLVADATDLTWEVTSSNTSWLVMSALANATSGASPYASTDNKTLYALATTANTSTTTPRKATLTLTRLGMPAKPAKIITVTQVNTPLPLTVKPTSVTLNAPAGSSVPIFIDNRGTGLEWTAKVVGLTLDLAFSADGKGAANSLTGTESDTIYVYATKTNYSITKDAAATLTISREAIKNITIPVTHKQTKPYKPARHKGWAGCNIYWDKDYVNDDGSVGRLTFDDVGDTTHEDYQGVFFLWGSLVAVSPNADYTTGSILFSPTGKRYGFSSMPSAIEAGLIGDAGRAYLIECHDPNLDRGDICRYMSEKGWAPGSAAGRSWRLPTEGEADAIGTVAWYGGTYDYKQVPNNRFGQAQIPWGVRKSGVITLPFARLMCNDRNCVNHSNQTYYQTSTPMTNGSGNLQAMPPVAIQSMRNESKITTTTCAMKHATGIATALTSIRCVQE